MTTPHVVPLTPAQFADAKRSAPLTSAELLRSRLSAGAPKVSRRVVSAWSAR